MDFSSALRGIKGGHRLARSGWNGKNMFVWLNRGSRDFPDDEPRPAKVDGVRTEMFDMGDTGTSTRLPNINMSTASGAIVTGWLASQTDMLADDWEVVL